MNMMDISMPQVTTGGRQNRRMADPTGWLSGFASATASMHSSCFHPNLWLDKGMKELAPHHGTLSEENEAFKTSPHLLSFNSKFPQLHVTTLPPQPFTSPAASCERENLD
jgi:hypothetical protein